MAEVYHSFPQFLQRHDAIVSQNCPRPPYMNIKHSFSF